MAPYVRVSEILSRLRSYAHINPVILREKAELGTEVHHNIAEDKNGGFPMFDKWPIRHAISGNIMLDDEGNERWEKKGIGYFKSFCEWDKAYTPKFGIMEQRFNDDALMITGQLDALVNMPGEETPTLIDFKCSYKPDLEIWSMQAHFYWYLLKQNNIDVQDKFIWIQLKKDGKKPSAFTFNFDERVMARCVEEANKYWEEKKAA